MPADARGVDPCPSVIRVPGLSDSGVGRPEVPDKWEDPQNVCDHDQGISLDHPLLAVKEVTRPVALPDHKCSPVAVAVELKPLATGTLVAHCPQYGCAVLLMNTLHA